MTKTMNVFTERYRLFMDRRGAFSPGSRSVDLELKGYPGSDADDEKKDRELSASMDHHKHGRSR